MSDDVYELNPKYIAPKIAFSHKRAKSIVEYLEKYQADLKNGIDKNNEIDQMIYHETFFLIQAIKSEYNQIKVDPYLTFYKLLSSYINNFLTKITSPNSMFIKMVKKQNNSDEKKMKELKDKLNKLEDNIGQEFLKISKIAVSEVKARSKNK